MPANDGEIHTVKDSGIGQVPVKQERSHFNAKSSFHLERCHARGLGDEKIA
jgi:hypothetical protein